MSEEQQKTSPQNGADPNVTQSDGQQQHSAQVDGSLMPQQDVGNQPVVQSMQQPYDMNYFPQPIYFPQHYSTPMALYPQTCEMYPQAVQQPMMYGNPYDANYPQNFGYEQNYVQSPGYDQNVGYDQNFGYAQNYGYDQNVGYSPSYQHGGYHNPHFQPRYHRGRYNQNRCRHFNNTHRNRQHAENQFKLSYPAKDVNKDDQRYLGTNFDKQKNRDSKQFEDKDQVGIKVEMKGKAVNAFSTDYSALSKLNMHPPKPNFLHNPKPNHSNQHGKGKFDHTQKKKGFGSSLTLSDYLPESLREPKKSNEELPSDESKVVPEDGNESKKIVEKKSVGEHALVDQLANKLKFDDLSEKENEPKDSSSVVLNELPVNVEKNASDVRVVQVDGALSLSLDKGADSQDLQ